MIEVMVSESQVITYKTTRMRHNSEDSSPGSNRWRYIDFHFGANTWDCTEFTALLCETAGVVSE
jgi:hypothetical protein